MVGRAAKLLWLRGFNRESVEQLMGVLLRGDEPNPDDTCRTQVNERRLQIKPARVYAYLGQTLEEFGRCAFAVPFEALAGDASPFDTGGLIAHLKPVCEWSDDSRRAEFLRTHTWPTAGLGDLLDTFPGEQISAYLTGKQPSGGGICERLSDDCQEPVALWRDNQDWRAWIWEARVPGQLSTGEELVAWTCPPDMFEALVSLAPTIKQGRASLLTLIKKYHRGGVSALIEHLRVIQERAA